jgi:hypothetical protein
LTTDRRDVDGVWTVLGSSLPSSGITVAPFGYDVAAGPLLAGIDSDGRRHLLIPLLPGEAARTNVKGRAVHLGRVSHNGTQYLTVVCLLADLHHVFTQFCRELTSAVEAAPSPAREAAAAFDRWKDLFSDAVVPEQLSEDSLVGLLGELLVLGELLSVGASPELAYWAGPLHQVHDFRTLTYALEVKATLLRDGRVISISSVDQLQAPPGAALFLRHIRLERDPAGVDLEKLVDRVLAGGASREALRRLLNELGVGIDNLAQYSGRKYRVVEQRTYNVAGTAFPRITRSSFTVGDLPPGTLRLSYSVELTNEPPFPLSDADALVVLTSLASEAAHGMGS